MERVCDVDPQLAEGFERRGYPAVMSDYANALTYTGVQRQRALQWLQEKDEAGRLDAAKREELMLRAALKGAHATWLATIAAAFSAGCAFVTLVLPYLRHS